MGVPSLGGCQIHCDTGIGNVIQAPPHSVLRANTFSVGQQATNSFDTSTVSISVCPRAWLKL